jgi:hypothetical protein
MWNAPSRQASMQLSTSGWDCRTGSSTDPSLDAALNYIFMLGDALTAHEVFMVFMNQLR